MRLSRTCPIWILAILASSACGSTDAELGHEGVDSLSNQDGVGGKTASAGGHAGVGGGGTAGSTAGSNRGGSGGSQGVGGSSHNSGGAGQSSIDAGHPDVRVDSCQPAAYYGPQPCQTSSECVQRQGAGWYCDTTNAFTDSCGTRVTWPLCKQSIDDGGPKPDADACQPSDIYGPLPCSTDEECVQRNAAGWYCDKTSGFTDSCGSRVSWPMCKQSINDGGPKPDADACIPAAIYGPQPCQNTSECVQREGAGWYCDLQNSFSDSCGRTVTWPMCKQ
jgi:hypothetical protein